MDSATPTQAQEDLQFLRDVVEGDEPRTGPLALAVLWAVIGTVGYALLDVSVGIAVWYWPLACIVGYVASLWIVRRLIARSGVVARNQGRHGLHWISLAGTSAAVIAITVTHQLPGLAQGQLFTLMTGIVWYFAGVHLDRRFMLPGIVLVACAALVPTFPVLPWTTVGVCLGVSLIASALWMRPRTDAE